MEPELDRRLAGIETKLDTQDGKLTSIVVQLPRFVTWAKLGGATATIAGIVIAAVQLLQRL